MRRMVAVVGVLIALGLYFGVSPKPEARIEVAPHQVKILRDTFGVPHIFGKTDPDVAFGLAYAHAEDDFKTIIESLLASRGVLASVQGKDAAPIDFMLRLMKVRETVDEKFDTDLSPEVRAICSAYADGLNKYALDHPGSIDSDLLPFTAKDIVAGFVFKAPFFFGLDNAVQELFGEKRRREVSTKSAEAEVSSFWTNDLPIGSNTFAVGATRSEDGATRLNINSHQPWEGPVAWYEAHVHSEEGWDAVGGLFPGTPVILVGHNRNLGWAHTVNKPDLVDIFVMEVNPDNPNQYKFDGAWKDFEVRKVPIKVKLWGPISWTFKREALWCVYGPAVRQPHGVYAIKWAGMGDIRQVEQWYRMNRAQNMQEWLTAMRTQSIPSLNCGYADKDGNILYLYNAKSPIRATGYDWSKYLPGDTSETLWTEYMPFESLPLIVNPKCGYIYNSNNTPYKATAEDENVKPESFPATMGIETHMTNRALRAGELLSADTSISEDEFYTIKYDMAYSSVSDVARKWQMLADAPDPEDPLAKEALAVLRKWDLKTNPENTSAAISVLSVGPDSDGNATVSELPKLIALMTDNAKALKAVHGKIDVPWSEVNRLKRGDVNVGLGGGPDILHAVYGSRVRDGKLEGLENGQLTGRAGDCYVIMVTWDKDGKVHSRSIHQYGSATLDKKSKHYSDQVPLFVKRETKPVWFDEADIRANLEREYDPSAMAQ